MRNPFFALFIPTFGYGIPRAATGTARTKNREKSQSTLRHIFLPREVDARATGKSGKGLTLGGPPTAVYELPPYFLRFPRFSPQSARVSSVFVPDFVARSIGVRLRADRTEPVRLP
ncbi:hypothetical protein KM043_018725 [Ampulex compressa]|nr:hypothetical protein KM043_018725 [Ampulex compressa]